MRRTAHLSIVAALLVAVGIAACTAGRGAPGGSGAPTTADEAARIAIGQEARFAGIGPLDEDLIGQAAWYAVTPSDAGWTVLIRIGWGDCQAGCISEHRWTYAVGRDGRVSLTKEEGDLLSDATGVRGIVTAGPTCPVVRDPPDPACADRPVAGAVLVIADPGGAEVARATSAADGTFAVELPPGAYRLTAQPVEGLMGTPAPMDIQVAAGAPSAELQVTYDTGIR